MAEELGVGGCALSDEGDLHVILDPDRLQGLDAMAALQSIAALQSMATLD